MTVQAVVLAAGRGSRLAPLTDDRPKCMVELAGRPLIEWQLAALRRAGVDRIGIVTGYRAERLAPYASQQWHNPRWAKTNMVASMLSASEVFDGEGDVLIAYSDIVYEPQVLQTLLETPGDIVTVIDRNWLELWQARNEDPLLDAETLVLDDDDRILEIGKRPKNLDKIEGQYVGLTRLTSAGCRKAVELIERGRNGVWQVPKPIDNIHFTDLLAGLIATGEPVRAAPCHGGWLEIDTTNDLAVYDEMWRGSTLDRFVRLERIAD